MLRALIATSILCAAACPALAADAPGVVRISPEEAKGAVFKRPDAVKSDKGQSPTTNVTMLRSADKKAYAGVYEAGASRDEIESYGVDEFMYFLSGSVTLTGADGVITKIAPGDAVTIAKGWKGVWETPGYTKYYVIYRSDAAPAPAGGN